MFPSPAPVRRVLCAKCRTHWVRTDRLIGGLYGESCAAQLGLIAATPRLHAGTQDGFDLIDYLNEIHEPEDHCDGHDR